MNSLLCTIIQLEAQKRQSWKNKRVGRIFDVSPHSPTRLTAEVPQETVQLNRDVNIGMPKELSPDLDTLEHHST
jgi:hypothetical protein